MMMMMGKKGGGIVRADELIEISPSSSDKEEGRRRKKMTAPPQVEEEEDDGTPIRHIFCLKGNANIKHYEQTEDCFILDFDPYDSLHYVTRRLSVSAPGSSPASDPPPPPPPPPKAKVDEYRDDDDLSVIAEKGQVVACRDYPHSRHLCLKYPFGTTPHETHCQLCYCYVCDCAAPCKFWTDPLSAHCRASDHFAHWRDLRHLNKKKKMQPSLLSSPFSFDSSSSSDSLF